MSCVQKTRSRFPILPNQAVALERGLNCRRSYWYTEQLAFGGPELLVAQLQAEDP